VRAEELCGTGRGKERKKGTTACPPAKTSRRKERFINVGVRRLRLGYMNAHAERGKKGRWELYASEKKSLSYEDQGGLNKEVMGGKVNFCHTCLLHRVCGKEKEATDPQRGGWSVAARRQGEPCSDGGCIFECPNESTRVTKGGRKKGGALLASYTKRKWRR